MNEDGKQKGTTNQKGFESESIGGRRREAETLLVREVEEWRGRAVQMEKTMRFVLHSSTISQWNSMYQVVE